MNLLMIIQKHLPIGWEGWKAIQLDHKGQHPGWCEAALRRKFATLHCCTASPFPLVTPISLQRQNVAKLITHLIGNKAATEAAEEDFDLEEIEFGER